MEPCQACSYEYGKYKTTPHTFFTCAARQQRGREIAQELRAIIMDYGGSDERGKFIYVEDLLPMAEKLEGDT